MTDLSMPPLTLVATDQPVDDAASSAESSSKSRHAGFGWPTPPFAGYAASSEQTEAMACVIAGVNGKLVRGRLIQFVPDEQAANVQVPPARTTMTLQFSQFRTLALVEPLSPQAADGRDPHVAMLAHRPRTRFSIKLRNAELFEGETIGHVDTWYGVFLFPPLDDAGRVTRIFVPAANIESRDLGPKLGEVLVETRAATQRQVAEAVQLQTQMRERKLGDILVTQNIVSPEQLLGAIEQQSKMPMMRIGEALIALKLITAKQLDDALEQQKQDRSVPIGQLLVRLGWVSRQDLQTALARKMGYPVVDATQFAVDPEALKKLPPAIAQRLNVLPLLLRDATLVCAMEDPTQRATLEELEFASRCKIVPVLARQSEIFATLPTAYKKIGLEVVVVPGGDAAASTDYDAFDSGKLLESLERENADAVHKHELSEKQIEQSDNSLVRLIHTMIIEAHQQGVSDIHIETHPGKEKLKIRFRKDGVMKPYLELPHTYRNAMVGRIKIMCDLDISERRKPQDGKINFVKFSATHKLELRVATIPTNNGLEDVVMRLLASAKPVPVDKLGLSARNLERLKAAMERPYGMVLCVGPTGSGKTTTLHSALSHINVPERKIWTAEDPVEITQPGLRQVQVNPKIEWTFAKALRAFLRADPDVIMVGEIRDSETAQIAVEASLTGHLVLSTLHTNSAPETVTRLLDMGMDPFNFADSLLLVLAQRLVRRLCSECKISRPMTDEEFEELLDDHQTASPAGDRDEQRASLRLDWLARHGRDGRLTHFHAPGCHACGHSGYRGRLGLHELMTVSRPLRRLIQTGSRAEELQAQALTEGMATLRQDGIEKVLMGLTTIDEVRSTSNA